MFLQAARDRREIRERQIRERRAQIRTSGADGTPFSVDSSEEEDSTESSSEDGAVNEEAPSVSPRVRIKPMYASAPDGKRQSARPVVPTLRITTRLDVDMKDTGPSSDPTGGPGEKPAQSRTRSKSISPFEGPLTAIAKKVPLGRSLSQRVRRPADLVVSDTDFGSQSWTSPRQVISPRKENVTSPRKWSLLTPRGSTLWSRDTLLQANLLLLSSKMRWKKRFAVVRSEGNVLEISRRDKRENHRIFRLTEATLRADTAKVVAGRQFVLELSSCDGPLVLGLESRTELRRWSHLLSERSAKTDGGNNLAAFPGIRMIQVQEEEADATWEELVRPTAGWRVELSTTPVDVTFGSSTDESSDFDNYFKSANGAWVGIDASGELFVAIVAHSDEFSRMLVRTKAQDRLVEFLPMRNDLKLVRFLEPREFYPVNNHLSRVRELDSIGAQNMGHFQTFKFGVLLVCSGDLKNESILFQRSTTTPDFEAFVGLLGTEIDLKNKPSSYSGYTGGLDGKDASRVVVANKNALQLAFHIAPWIGERSRKRYIGNDYCVLIFMETDEPFRPEIIKTKLTHVYIIIRKDLAASLATGQLVYKVACVLREGMPTFGPRLIRNPIYEGDFAFVDFLLTKLLNGERGARFAPDFLKTRCELRNWWLEQLLAENSK